jgi:hypothetical protein
MSRGAMTGVPMIRRMLLAVGVGVMLLAPVPSHAGIERAGTTAANFLSVGTGPAVLAMGGTAIGRWGGLELATWNPGALGWLQNGSVMLAHANLDDQTSQEWIGVGGRFGKLPTRWALSGLYQGEGSIEGRDASNQPTASIHPSSIAVTGYLAQSFGPHVALGFGAKGVREDLGVGPGGSGVAFDAGLSLRFGMLGIGAAAQNAFGRMRFSGLAYPFPASYGAGVSLTHEVSGLTAACDVNVPDAYYENVRGGLEWQWKRRVALRAGYRAEMGATADEPLGGPTFGMGAGGHGFWFDYGYLISGNQGGQHRIAISLRPSGMGWKGGDPFDQRSMPREFGDSKLVGPPAPQEGAKKD